MKPKHLYLALAVLLVSCWNSVGFHQSDEHWQILEFASYKLGNTPLENLAWEFGEQMRPALQPFMVYLSYRAFSVFGEVNPHWFTFFLRLVSAAMFLLIVFQLFRRYAPVFSPELKRLLGLFLLFHWVSVYVGIRFSGENWSGMLTVLGFLVYPIPATTSGKQQLTPTKNGPAWWCFAAGLLFGASFLLRYQMAVGVLGFGAWLLFVGKERWSRLALVILGGVVMLGIGAVLDYWMYGEWVNAPWNYLRINVFEGVAATYGSRPWWGYLELIFLRGIPPLGLVYLVAIGYFCWRFRRDPLSWLTIAFIIVHSILSRKDIRFLFPLATVLPIALLVLYNAVLDRYGKDAFTRTGWWKRGYYLLLFVNFGILAAVMVRPVASELHPFEYVYDNYPEGVTIYSDRRLLYVFGGLTTDFYKRPNTALIEGRPPTTGCPGPTPCLYSAHTHDPQPPAGAKLVYTNRSNWVQALNFGGWQDGMKWWYVYELQ